MREINKNQKYINDEENKDLKVIITGFMEK